MAPPTILQTTGDRVDIEIVDDGLDETAERNSAAGPRVVVGVDGSPGSREALVYAVEAASRRGAELEVVTSYALELYYLGGAAGEASAVSGVRDDVRASAKAVLTDLLDEPALAAQAEGLTVRLLARQGPPAQSLVERSAGADLLVVGSRGRGAVRSLLLGSVALHCATHAACPVAVVHPAATTSGQRLPRVVVGVDGSEASQLALAAAVEEAVGLGAELLVVSGFLLGDVWPDVTTVSLPTVEQMRAPIQARNEAMLAEVLAARSGPAPEVRIEVVEGPSAEILVNRSEIADLLVVGSRGRGALRGLMLGSVALHCVMRASGPVLVVRPVSPAAGTQAGS